MVSQKFSYFMVGFTDRSFKLKALFITFYSFSLSKLPIFVGELCFCGRFLFLFLFFQLECLVRTLYSKIWDFSFRNPNVNVNGGLMYIIWNVLNLFKHWQLNWFLL